MLTTNIPSDRQCRAYCKVMRVLRETILATYGHHVVHIDANFGPFGYEIILYVPEDQVEEYKRKYDEIREEIEEIQLNDADIAVAIQGLYVDPGFLLRETYPVIPRRESPLGEEIYIQDPQVGAEIHPVVNHIPVHKKRICCPVFYPFA